MQQVVEKVLDVLAVVGMLMGEEQLGGGHDGAGFVAVHPGDLVGPFPSLSDEPEAETADVQVRNRGGGHSASALRAGSGFVMPRLFHQ